MEQFAFAQKVKQASRAKGKGKQTKRFLEKNDALDLAASIANIQEGKSLSKAEKHHHAQIGQPHKDGKPKISASKMKLKETKALLAAQRSQIKKDKAKLRKQRPPDKSSTADSQATTSLEKPGKTARKRVSFA